MLPRQQLGIRRRIVNVANDGRIGNRDIDGPGHVAMDHVAGFRIQRQRDQFVNHLASDADRMAMLAGVGGYDNRSRNGAEPIRQGFDGRGFHVRMIYRQKHGRGGVRGNQRESALQRTQHAALGIGILGEEHLAATLDTFANHARVLSHHHDDGSANRGEDPDEPVEERFILKSEEGFRASHTARRAARENDSGNFPAAGHLRTARDASLAKIDLAAVRHSASGARCIAIISATTETAISSGVMAPISSPMGANTRSKATRAMPSFSSSFTTPITLRLLPIIAMYLALVSTAQRSTRMSSRWPRVTMIT